MGPYFLHFLIGLRFGKERTRASVLNSKARGRELGPPQTPVECESGLGSCKVADPRWTLITVMAKRQPGYAGGSRGELPLTPWVPAGLRLLNQVRERQCGVSYPRGELCGDSCPGNGDTRFPGTHG